MPIQRLLGTSRLRGDHLHGGIREPSLQKHLFGNVGEFPTSGIAAWNAAGTMGFGRWRQLLLFHLVPAYY
jgi:hypothetical protein